MNFIPLNCPKLENVNHLNSHGDSNDTVSSELKLKYKSLKGNYINTPFRVDEHLERYSSTGKVCLDDFKFRGGELFPY